MARLDAATNSRDRPRAARGATPARHRAGRGARRTRRDDREYWAYLREEQGRQAGYIGRRMQRVLHHGLLAHDALLHGPERRRRAGRDTDLVVDVLNVMVG